MKKFTFSLLLFSLLATGCNSENNISTQNFTQTAPSKLASPGNPIPSPSSVDELKAMYDVAAPATASNLPLNQVLQCTVLRTNSQPESFDQGLILFADSDSSFRNEGNMYPAFFNYFTFESSLFTLVDGTLQAREQGTGIFMEFRVNPTGDLVGVEKYCDDSQCFQGNSGVLCSKIGVPKVSELPTASLDPSFGSQGVAVGEFIPVGDILVQSDDKAIAIGDNASRSIILQRFNPDATLDTTFGENGQTLISYGPDTVPEYVRSALNPNSGEIVVLSTVQPKEAPYVALTTLKSDGSLDSTFGSNGTIKFQFPKQSGAQMLSMGQALAVRPDGRILISVSNMSWEGVPGVADSLSLLQYLPNGESDKGFGQNGMISLTGFEPNEITVLDNGQILLTNTLGNQVFFRRLNANGQVDANYGIAGVLTVTLLGTQDPMKCFSWPKITRGSGGNYSIVFSDACALGNSDLVVGLIDKYGNIVNSFGQNGFAATYVASSTSHSYPFFTNSQLLADGSVLVTKRWQGSGFVVIKFRPDGSLDPQFGNGGKSITIPGNDTEAFTPTADASGKPKTWGLRSGKIAAVRFQ